MFFIFTVGVVGMTRGNPYIQRWADENNNIVARVIPCPNVVSTYFEWSPQVDDHNRT
jgi:hypothetical protein